MQLNLVLIALVALLPVIGLLAALVYFDSYKLVSLKSVIAVIVCGAAVAGASYLVNVFAFVSSSTGTSNPVSRIIRMPLARSASSV